MHNSRLKPIILLFLSLLLLGFSFYTRTPTLFIVRGWDVMLAIAISLILLTTLVKTTKRLTFGKFSLSLITFFVIGATFTHFVFKEIRFVRVKSSVLGANQEILQKWGQHIIVGYTDVENIKQLIEKGSIGGVFVTQRNIEGKAYEEFKSELESFQVLQKNQGRNPLLIMTDQEGGIVSRLSPPLAQKPSLASLISEVEGPQEIDRLVKEYASSQAQELADIGINVNLAPVVDLNYGIVSNKDRYSKISQRAISSDPDTVSHVGLLYSQTLLDNGVIPTLKHFPGLGSIEEDTHISQARLTKPVHELETSDWVPFREILTESKAFMMLSHVVLESIDPDNPVSISSEVISGVLRDDWQHDGILITDDFSMAPIFNYQAGIDQAAVNSINAGVDLILISYDHDLYFEVIDSLIEADIKGKISREIVARSTKRLNTIF